MIDNPAAIVSIGVSLLTGIGFIWAIKSSVLVLDTRLTAQDKVIAEVRTDLRALNKVVTELAVQDQRLSTIDERSLNQGKRLDEALQRFNVWIDDKARSS